MPVDPAAYGEAIAPFYDEVHDGVFDLETLQAAAVLTELAAGGRTLELGVGTGRLAIPLAAAGLEVHGVDASPAMLGRLTTKPGGDRVRVHLGDFSCELPEGPYALIYVVFNTFFALLTQDDQVRCFRSVADRLTAGGVFVLEGFVPNPALYESGRYQTIDMVVGELHMSTSTINPVTQRITSTQIALRAGGPTFVPIELRYAWPSELDLMGRLADLQLRHRWGGWGYEPFSSVSRTHVSVYAKS